MPDENTDSIESAIEAVDAVLSASPYRSELTFIRGELNRMIDQRDFMPRYGRILVDSGIDNDLLENQLLELLEWRRKALKRLG